MKEYKKVRSTQQPEPKVIDEFSVWVNTNITPVSEPGEDGKEGFEGFEYDQTQYDKDEYIKMIDEKNTALEEQLETTQEAVDFLLLGME